MLSVNLIFFSRRASAHGAGNMTLSKSECDLIVLNRQLKSANFDISSKSPTELVFFCFLPGNGRGEEERAAISRCKLWQRATLSCVIISNVLPPGERSYRNQEISHRDESWPAEFSPFSFHPDENVLEFIHSYQKFRRIFSENTSIFYKKRFSRGFCKKYLSRDSLF